MTTRRIGIIMNGVTGRMGTNQHLAHSILPIREEGGLLLPDGSRLLPDPILIGRNADKLRALAERFGIARWSTDLDAALADPDDTLYFDSGATQLRADNLTRAIAAGKHVYCEKPTAAGLDQAVEIVRLASSAGIRHGVVQDKLWAPGIAKLRLLLDGGFFGRVLTVRIEGCYWVFEGDKEPPQRPSWNYRKEDGGSMILDMMPHYRYMLDIFGAVERMTCTAATHIPRRWDEAGQLYTATADDAVFALMELRGGIIAQITSSWCVRVRRDDIITVQVDGTEGSAVAGLRECVLQPSGATPRAQWSLDMAEPIDFHAGWRALPDRGEYKNAFRAQWELFLQHIACGTDFPWDLAAGARGVQLAELAFESWHDRKWVEIPALAV